MNIPIKSTKNVPKYATQGSSGFDLQAIHILKYFNASNEEIPVENINTDNTIHLLPNARVLVGTGLFADIPDGYEIQVRSRSGLTLKQGLVVANGIGTIDSSYKGEIGVILTNTSNSKVSFDIMDRIAQGVLVKVEKATFFQRDLLTPSDREGNGYGSTGK